MQFSVFKPVARGEIKLKTKLPTVEASFQPTVDIFVLFQFHHVRTLKLFQVVSVFCFYFRNVWTREIKPTTGSNV